MLILGFSLPFPIHASWATSPKTKKSLSNHGETRLVKRSKSPAAHGDGYQFLETALQPREAAGSRSHGYVGSPRSLNQSLALPHG